MTMSTTKYQQPSSDDVSTTNRTKGLSNRSYSCGRGTESYSDKWPAVNPSLSEFQKSQSLDRPCQKRNNNHGKDRDNENVPIHGTPKRIPPPSPNTPSLWKRILSFRKSFSSQKDLSTIGHSKGSNEQYCRKKTENTCNVEYSKKTDDKTKVSQEGMKTDGRRFRKISNRLISELKHNSDGQSFLSPDRSNRVYMLSHSDTYTKDNNSNPDLSSTALINTPTSKPNLNTYSSITDINGNVNRENNDDERKIKITHYKCHPKRRSSSRNSTPPLVMFSSDEDISSTQTTPVHITKGNDNVTITTTDIDISSEMSNIPLFRSKNQCEVSRSRTPSSPVILTDGYHPNGKTKTAFVQEIKSTLSPASGDHHCTNSNEKNDNSAVDNKNTLNKTSKKTLQKVSDLIEIPVSKSELFHVTNAPILRNYSGNMKEEVYESSGDLPSTITAVVKPRLKVKRSVSCSPARPVRTISAELEERIGHILRHPPQRRLSSDRVVSPLREPVFLHRRASTSDKHTYLLLRNMDYQFNSNGAPPILAHSRSVPYQCSSMDQTEPLKKLNNNVNSLYSDAGCIEQKVGTSESATANTIKLQGDYNTRAQIKSRSNSCNKGQYYIHNLLYNEKDPVIDSNCSNKVFSPVKLKRGAGVESNNKRLFCTRRRHHTIEIGSSLSSNEGSTSCQNSIGPIEIKKKNTTKTPFYSSAIDSRGTDTNISANVYTSNEIQTKGQDNSTQQVTNTGEITCRGSLGQATNYKSDKTAEKKYHTSVYLELKNSSKSTTKECCQQLISNNENNKSKQEFNAVNYSMDVKEMGEENSMKDRVIGDGDIPTVIKIEEENKHSKYTDKKEQSLFKVDKERETDILESDQGIVMDKLSDSSAEDIQQMTSLDEDTHKECMQFSFSDGLFVPQRSPKERPKSEILCVRWADETDILEVQAPCSPSVNDRRQRKTRRERPKSDIGGRKFVTEALQTHKDLEESHSDSVCALQHREQRYLLPWEKSRLRQRRMSTPHPIKSRPSLTSSEASLAGDHVNSSSRASLLRRMKKCRSVPNLSVTQPNKKRKTIFHATSAHAGDLALQSIELNDTSDDEATSEETVSIGAVSEASSSGSTSKHTIDQLFDDQMPTYAEALWDHVTLDLEELAFQVGEVIKVTDMSDKDWWFGVIDDRQGWFPAAFVRLHANQMDTADDFVSKVKAGHMDGHTVLQKYSSNLLSKDQARTNVVTEIINAEREYVKHLKDVVEGYVEKARKRPEMFPDTMLATIFSNIEEIYKFSSQFIEDLEKHINHTSPHISEIGKCFLNNNARFEIYSEYCNNHPSACDELRVLQKNQKYKHFFEACRLLQQMIEIPLEGFLLTPVQKICKYPLQLKELLKYTRPEHPDCRNLQEALESMRHIAMLINERKRKLESVEKLAQWQQRVEDWEGVDLIEESSELIYSGEMTKVNSNGWHQERVFFLFDHQIMYCKKDLLWRDLLIYRGRINLDHCEVHSVQDGKDMVYNTNIKNGIKIYDSNKDRWFLMYCKTPELKDKWLNAFQQERHRVMQDRANGFQLEDYRNKAKQNNLRDKCRKDKKNRLSSKDFSYQLPSRQLTTSEAIQYAHSHNKKSGIIPFLKRKIKR